MAVLVTGSDFSSLDAFITVLRKLAAKDFVSKRLPRHYTIRKQSPLQSMDHCFLSLTTLHARGFLHNNPRNPMWSILIVMNHPSLAGQPQIASHGYEHYGKPSGLLAYSELRLLPEISANLSDA